MDATAHDPHPPLASGVAALACGVLALLVPCSPAAEQAAKGPTLHLPDGRRPAVLSTFRLPDDLLALAVSADGRRAALAVPVKSERRRATSAVRVHDDGGGVIHVPVDGFVRDLLFVGRQPTLYALQHRPAKRGEGEAYLLSVDLTTRKTRREMRLPPSARGLEYWPAARSLIVPSRDELRTVILPLLRSGPLFRVPGENLSVAILGGSRALVGQPGALLLVDLADPQTREELRFRARVSAPAPIVSLAVGADGRKALAGLADGRVADVELAPLALRARAGIGLVVEQGPPPAPEIEAAAPVAAEQPATPQPEIPEIEVEAPVAAEQPATPQPEIPGIERKTPTPQAVPSRTPPAAAAQIHGRLEGPAAAAVVAVVVLGPDNLLREAARVRPAADGSYTVRGLAPGRYRVQLDGGGGRVLVSEPAFHRVTVAEGDAGTAADFRVVGAL